MKTLRVLFILGISSFGVGVAHTGETWVSFHPPANISFSVLMPAQPQKLQNHDEWRVSDEVGGTYSAAMGYYTEPQRITQPESFMRLMIDRLAANTGAKVVYTWFFKQQYAPACEFKLLDLKNHQVAAGRYYLVHQWFYLLDYTAPDKAFDQGRMKKFFGSFQIINPQLKDFQPGS